MRTALRRFIFLGFALAPAVLFVYAWHYYAAPGPSRQDTALIFKRGERLQSIAADMAAAHVINHPLLFGAIALLSGDRHKFRAGEYAFPAAASPAMVMDMITHGRVVIHKLTVAEGLTVAEVEVLLDREAALEGSVPANIPEGGLLPDTYYFVYGDKKSDVIARMQAGMTKLLAQLWPKREAGLPFTTPQQAVTLASMVEKETGLAGERGHIAGVFVNRLRKGMKLQSDPTVAYGLGKPGTALTTADLQAPNPYNTYVISGLPPAPICNPGKASIEAALNPPDTSDLYFVATGNGGHNFAATLKQHDHNVQKYRQAVAKKQ
ncbi:MAG: endolytic transglycosylase MltG [Pseudomonadota bacterium]|nr:endolytic transglycosylase MltG [Pseudomonadota bacterium]MDE3037700.1 endolytic transglycosylase MltG [Pseudomonadota bacterium]